MGSRRHGQRNDPAQYDDLADQWWDPHGDFAMLAWIARARAALVPPATRPGALLLDVACGGGLLAPEIAGRGYRHIGVDLSQASVLLARDHGVEALRADVLRLPFDDESFDVVVAGEILEHVADHDRLVDEACRVLAPRGTLVLDTIARTRWGAFSAITIGERMPAGPPPLLHDATLFVDRRALIRRAAAHGVELRLSGLRPSVPGYLAWLARLREDGRMVTTRSTAGLFQAVGTKSGPRS